MLELLRKLILDFEELPLETGLPRQLKIETVRGKATICIGVRRSGKSTYMFQVMQGLLDQGVSRQNILYLNFFDDRLNRGRGWQNSRCAHLEISSNMKKYGCFDYRVSGRHLAWETACRVAAGAIAKKNIIRP